VDTGFTAEEISGALVGVEANGIDLPTVPATDAGQIFIFVQL
jgi:hypothetical protein